MFTVDFLWGIFTGLLIAALLGWLWSIYRNWVRTFNAYRRPQIVIHATNKTPAQVGREADIASLKIWIARFALLALLWLAVELFAPEAAQLAYRIIGDMWAMIFG